MTIVSSGKDGIFGPWHSIGRMSGEQRFKVVLPVPQGDQIFRVQVGIGEAAAEQIVQSLSVSNKVGPPIMRELNCALALPENTRVAIRLDFDGRNYDIVPLVVTAYELVAQ